METPSLAADPRYPIGRFERPSTVSAADRLKWIADIESLPAQLRGALEGLDDAQLDTPYRDGGWTIRQVVHHVADSHINSFVRFKLALTEANPTIKPYDEAAWAETVDSKALPVQPSLGVLDGVHQRWTALLRSLSEGDYQRTFQHPERGSMSLDANLALYSWHGRHHLAHVTRLRERMGW